MSASHFFSSEDSMPQFNQSFTIMTNGIYCGLFLSTIFILNRQINYVLITSFEINDQILTW